MMTSSNPGAKHSVSNRLQNYLQTADDEVVLPYQDEFDRFIARENLQIVRAAFFRDIDMMLIILSNRLVISRPLSAYPFLEQADDTQLVTYYLTISGIHWPAIDADLSLRGFLIEEAMQRFVPSRIAA